MREVACFLSPSLYKANFPSFIEGLRKNDIEVKCFDVFQHSQTGYTEQVREHNQRLAEREGCFCQQLQSHQEEHQHAPPLAHDYHFLCIAFEDSWQGVRAARRAGMCVVGIGCNPIERDRLRSQGAHAVAGSVSELLERFHVRNYYQVQYLPYVIYLREIVAKKVGYPVSLLDTLYGRFVKSSGVEGLDEIDDEEEDDKEEKKDDQGKSENAGLEQACHVELDNHANRLIPRDVLGIEPGSLADVYINNVGWPADKVPIIHFNSRGLEMDVIRIFGKYYRVPDCTMRGFVTSGGTEGNFTGLWWQRDYLKRLSNGARPVLLTSDQTHYSIAKAAQQLDIDTRTVRTLSTGEIDCDELSRVLDDIATSGDQLHPVLMGVNAGTTQTGAIDNLPKIHELLVDKVSSSGGHFSIHMDAALLGAVLPIINPFGEGVDYFNDLGVKTMAISGHKFFGSVTICGLLLTTESFLNDCFRHKDVNVEYLTGLHDITPSGSRNGFSVLSFHNTICGLYMHTDCRRLKAIVHQCYRNVDVFVERMTALVGADKVIRPPHSLQVCFPRPSDAMMVKYTLMPITLPFNSADQTVLLAGVCVLINVDLQRIDNFMSDYQQDEETQKHLL
jgi:histidine decarboxylase